jgi:hypothetical protein
MIQAVLVLVLGTAVGRWWVLVPWLVPLGHMVVHQALAKHLDRMA